ncbi:uncharacterized protein KY384_000408 [Bacidia gigantensis]|uniref:uncharacterized protein n=1 Tax=Bacidia gigantensis TaxID=2732470 RepID=UPI001D046B88|nr:uncharacterized protein KY384_000408 [Bacidia gigantensis]KAG8525648.1 hypothetical protein KY384_000408 [Bacidia gigantensis]
MSFKSDHIRFVEQSGLNKPYIERNFIPPKYIGQNGEANIDIISSALEKLSQRSGVLKSDEVLKPKADPTAKYDPDKVPDPLDFASKATNPDLQTVELPLISDVWNGNEPINYHVQLTVGSPPQTFLVDLDSGSSLFWLQAILDDELDPEILGQNTYRPSMSVAAVELGQSDRAKYGDGDLVNVSLFTDRVNVGKMYIPSAIVGAAPTNGIKVEFQVSKANGLLGLGSPTDPKNRGRRNLVQTLYDLKLVKHASFALIGPRVDPKLAEKIDKQVIMQPRGTFVIGSVDPAYYTGSIAWCPQIVSTNRWVVKLDQILINGKIAFENQQALIDTGTAYIVSSPSNFDKSQEFIEGASPRKNGLMFTFPSENLQSVEFVLGGRKIRLQPQDFGLGGIKNEAGRMCSSIVKLPKWEFEESLWVLGGIFLDNVVTIFDYDERKVGFADISEKDLASATKIAPANSTADATQSVPTSSGAGAAVPAPTTAPASGSAPKSQKLIASDASYSETSIEKTPSGGREIVQRISFGQKPQCQIATGLTSFDLGYQHVRLITFATDNSYNGFNLHVNASADTATHGVLPNPDSDTVLRYGKAAWLRTLPNDPNIQIGRYTLGDTYPQGKQLPPDNTATVKFPRAFASPPKVVLWLCAMDFSKSVNWRLKADVSNITADGFTMVLGPWKDTILYKTEVCWIAHADVPGIQSGMFSTEDIRGGEGWQLNNSGFAKFEKKFRKPPRLVAALSKLEFGYYRDIRVRTTTEASEEGVRWSMDSDGDVHQYITRCSYIAFDAVSDLPLVCDFCKASRLTMGLGS